MPVRHVTINIPDFMSGYLFWFYCRKAFFQAFLPVLLGIITVSDFLKTSENIHHPPSHLYFYTFFMLVIYSSFKKILEFIFNVCAVDVSFKTDINSDQSVLKLLEFSENIKHSIVVIKKVFKLKYSKFIWFKYIDKLCWYLGIDSPIFIPLEVIDKLNDDATYEMLNDKSLLCSTLTKLYTFQSNEFEIDNELGSLIRSNDNYQLNNTINNVKHKLFLDIDNTNEV